MFLLWALEGASFVFGGADKCVLTILLPTQPPGAHHVKSKTMKRYAVYIFIDAFSHFTHKHHVSLLRYSSPTARSVLTRPTNLVRILDVICRQEVCSRRSVGVAWVVVRGWCQRVDVGSSLWVWSGWVEWVVLFVVGSSSAAHSGVERVNSYISRNTCTIDFVAGFVSYTHLILIQFGH